MGPLPAVQTVSKHKDKVRMLVLETDETHPDTQKEIGGFGEVFNNLFVKAGDDHDPQLGIETMMQYIVEPEGGEVPGPNDIPEDLHAILITGSEWDAHGDDEWIHKLMDFVKCAFPYQHNDYHAHQSQTFGHTAPTLNSPGYVSGTRSSAAHSAQPSSPNPTANGSSHTRSSSSPKSVRSCFGHRTQKSDFTRCTSITS